MGTPIPVDRVKAGIAFFGAKHARPASHGSSQTPLTYQPRHAIIPAIEIDYAEVRREAVGGDYTVDALANPITGLVELWLDEPYNGRPFTPEAIANLRLTSDQAFALADRLVAEAERLSR